MNVQIHLFNYNVISVSNVKKKISVEAVNLVKV
jgi:hypothetical protein